MLKALAALRLRAPLVLHLLLTLGIATATAQDVQPRNGILQEYNLTAWTEREGLASPRVTALAQTADGYLWVGTMDGLTRFDGTEFAPWDDLGSPTLPLSHVSSLCMESDGSLWVGYLSGTIARISGGHATIHEDIGTATGGTINALTIDGKGALWIAARSGLLRIDGRRVTRLTGADGVPEGPILNTYEDRHGDLWISSSTGIFRRRLAARLFEPVMSASYFDHRVTVDAKGAVWITDPRRGFQRMTTGASAGPSVTVGTREGLGVQILAGRRGAVWVATLGQGVWRIREPERTGDIETLGANQGLLNEVVRCLLEDREENIWIGTDYGLYRLSRNKLIPVQRLGVVRVVQADAASVWVGTSNGLIRFHGTEQTVYGRSGELPSPFISALHLDSEGSLWIATDHGVAVYRDGGFHQVPLQGIEQLNRIYSMTRDGRGRLWLADFNRGLFRTEGTRLEAVDVPPLLDHRAVLSVHRDQEGRLWLAVSDGTVGYVNESDETLQFHVPPGLLRANVRLNGVFQQGPGDVWLATSGGARHYKDGRVITVSGVNGVPSAQVSAIAGDLDGSVWLGTSAGVVRLDPGAIASIDGDSRTPVPYGLWDAYDGAAGAPVWIGTPSVSRDRSGRLWFVTANGLSIAEPDRLRGTTPPPSVVIQSILVGARRLAPESGLTLPPRSSPIEIDYAAVMLSAAHKVRFRYRLDNFEQGWTDAGLRREALFTNLPPGEYTFHVMAMATDGSSSQSSAMLRFSVQPAFTQTAWFVLGLMAALSVLLWYAWRLRLKYVQRQFALVINERIRMSREIHDTLLQSLIGVTLQLDALSANESASEATRSTLTRVRRQLEEDIRETRQSIWNLRSPKLENSTLAALLRDAGRRLTAATPVSFKVTVTGTARRLRSDVEQQILRIAEQAIVNAVRHGSASEVEVELEFTHKTLTLKVIDNGRGFDESDVSGESNFHYGLASMRERTMEIGGCFNLRTEPGRGTAVEAVVPA